MTLVSSVNPADRYISGRSDEDLPLSTYMKIAVGVL